MIFTPLTVYIALIDLVLECAGEKSFNVNIIDSIQRPVRLIGRFTETGQFLVEN